MKNSSDQEGCYPRRSKVEVVNTLPDLQNSSYATKAELNYSFIQNIFKAENELFVFLLTKNNIASSTGFPCQRFNNLQRAALLTSLF